MHPTPAITVQKITKQFRAERGFLAWFRAAGRASPIRALNEVTLEVAAGEVFGLVGPNGVGKTTLLRILSTLVLPDTGTARIDGFDVVRQPREARSRLGLILELERSFYARLSGRQNLEFFASLYELEGARTRRRVRELLELVGLAEAGERPFIKYSLGMQHRLGLARALLPDPSVLLLDEPTRSLDPGTADELGRLLREEFAHRRGKTVLLASHNLGEVEKLCDRIAILDRGRSVAVGSPSELARRFNCATLEEAYRRAVASGTKGAHV